MPEQVLMDTIYVTEETLFGETWKLANITFPDPAGVANKYRFIQYINSVRTEELFIRDEQLVNGREFETKLYMTPGTDDEDLINSGDSVKIRSEENKSALQSLLRNSYAAICMTNNNKTE